MHQFDLYMSDVYREMKPVWEQTMENVIRMANEGKVVKLVCNGETVAFITASRPFQTVVPK